MEGFLEGGDRAARLQFNRFVDEVDEVPAQGSHRFEDEDAAAGLGDCTRVWVCIHAI